MKVIALDHVNIITADLDGTATYYAEMFGLRRGNAPPSIRTDHAQWMYDESDRPIVHINSIDCPRAFEREVSPGPTGSIHHVALNCTGFDGMIERLQSRGADYRVGVVSRIGLRQIFTMDPNGVLLELNFRAD